MNYGYQNELDFVELFNNKYLYELDVNSQKFLKELFEVDINNDEVIKSWKNKMLQKTGIIRISYSRFCATIVALCLHLVCLAQVVK